MKDHDRTSIHEAMEQQSISVSKAGIVTSLQARCTVIAAANPIGGRYDSSRTFADNVGLTEPILSRFDILCVVRDSVDPIEDDLLADFVIGNHQRMHPDNKQQQQEETMNHTQMLDGGDSSSTGIAPMPRRDPISGVELIPQPMLRKYIAYARDNIHPHLDINSEKISTLYAKIRTESERTGSVAITVRSVESMIRVAEAHAKLHLRSHVIPDDVDTATRIILESFISTQKASVMKQMRQKFTRELNHKRNANDLLLCWLKDLVKQRRYMERCRRGDNDQSAADTQVEIPESDLIDKARHMKIDNIQAFYKSRLFQVNRFTVDPIAHVIRQNV